MFNNLGLALAANLRLCTSVAIGLKLKVRKFWGPNHTFVEVPGGKLVGGQSPPPPVPILNRVKTSLKSRISIKKSIQSNSI